MYSRWIIIQSDEPVPILLLIHNSRRFLLSFLYTIIVSRRIRLFISWLIEIKFVPISWLTLRYSFSFLFSLFLFKFISHMYVYIFSVYIYLHTYSYIYMYSANVYRMHQEETIFFLIYIYISIHVSSLQLHIWSSLTQEWRNLLGPWYMNTLYTYIYIYIYYIHKW